MESKAEIAYEQMQSHLLGLLKDIQKKVKQKKAKPNWSDVGSLNYVLSQLNNIKEFYNV